MKDVSNEGTTKEPCIRGHEDDSWWPWESRDRLRADDWEDGSWSSPWEPQDDLRAEDNWESGSWSSPWDLMDEPWADHRTSTSWPHSSTAWGSWSEDGWSGWAAAGHDVKAELADVPSWGNYTQKSAASSGSACYDLEWSGESWNRESWSEGQETANRLVASGAPEWYCNLGDDDRVQLQEFFSNSGTIYGTPEYAKKVEKFKLTPQQTVDMEACFCVGTASDILSDSSEQLGQPVDLIAGNVAVQTSLTQPLSQSHRAKYMRFLRGGRNPRRSGIGKLSVQKFGGDITDRVELFTTWLKSNQDWGACELMEQRYHDMIKRKKNTHAWKTEGELMVIFNQCSETVGAIVDACKKSKGHNRKHLQFPATPPTTMINIMAIVHRNGSDNSDDNNYNNLRSGNC